MTPRDFVFWLSGYLEAIEPPEGFDQSSSHLRAIRRTVDIVVSDIEDPGYDYSAGTGAAAEEPHP